MTSTILILAGGLLVLWLGNKIYTGPFKYPNDKPWSIWFDLAHLIIVATLGGIYIFTVITD